MIKCRAILFLLILPFVMYSCDGLKFPGNILETSERAKYERQFSGNDSLMTIWKADFSSAVKNNLQIEDGFSLALNLKNQEATALGYSITLQQGDLIFIESDSASAGSKIFIDFFPEALGAESSKSQLLQNGKFSKFIEEEGKYKLIVQPEIGLKNFSFLKIYTQPSLAFPVANKNNSDVQSFWGASRDGGARNHEGLDIFAPRGTPVTSASPGLVVRTGNEGLGGKQVWLRDKNSGYSHYYAHLDSIMVHTGQQINTGDILGTVGNTGNAKGGATHLHFGIYTPKGAVDAFPFIRKRPVPPRIAAALPLFTVVKSGSNIRTGPGETFKIIETQEIETRITILGQNGLWYQVKTEKGVDGFVSKARLK